MHGTMAKFLTVSINRNFSKNGKNMSDKTFHGKSLLPEWK